MSCAEGLANQSEPKPFLDGLRWLFTPLGRQFFLSCDWSVKSKDCDGLYSSQRDTGMPSQRVSQSELLFIVLIHCCGNMMMMIMMMTLMMMF